MRDLIKPGFFGTTVPADTKRFEFDIRNHQLISSGRNADVVFFGDSITQHWELDLYFNPSLLKINRGIGSDSTRYAAKRFDADVLQLEPKVVVILLGINDLIRVSPNFWYRRPGANPDSVIEEIETNFRDMLKKCTGREVYICSVLPQTLCEPHDRVLYDKLIVRTNVILKNLCDEFGATYVDYYSAMCVDGGLPDELTDDGVHPNGNGYAIMAKVLKEAAEML